MINKVLTKGQFNYCVINIAMIEVREKINFFDKKVKGLRFFFHPITWRKWEWNVRKFSDLANQSIGIRACLTEEELSECYQLLNQYKYLKYEK